MATLDNSGIQPKDLSGYTTDLEQIFRDALGDDLDVSTETPQGQLIGILALAFAEVEELIVYVAAGLNRYQASGRQLDDYGTLLRLPRVIGERSSVTATLTGASDALIPAGSRAQTTAGAQFETDEDIRIETSGEVDVIMRATEDGPIAAAADTLTVIVDVVEGWTGVTNDEAASLGRGAESDAEYRDRYTDEVTVHAADSLSAIQARVLDVEGALRCLVRDNDTTTEVTEQSIAIPANSILVIVLGGADDDVAESISETKPPGIPTNGTTTVEVTLPEGNTTNISFHARRGSRAAGNGYHHP